MSAFAFHNQDIGYAQSMNIIASILLLYLPEPLAFKILCSLCERILPDHYSKSLVGSVLEQRVFEELLKIYFPKIWRKLCLVMEMELSLLTFPWFVCLFINNFQIREACRIVDVFFLEGPVYLQWLALSIFQLNESEILTAKDEEQVMLVFKRFFDRFNSHTEPSSDETADKDYYYSATEKSIVNLLNLAYEFSFITARKMEDLKSRYRLEVVQKLEMANKKMTVRNLQDVSSFSTRELNAVYEDYRMLNFTSTDNTLKYNVFHELCCKYLPWPLTGQITKRFFHLLVTKGSGKVGLLDYIEFADILCHQSITERLVLLFNIHDDDNDGYLCDSELLLLKQR